MVPFNYVKNLSRTFAGFGFLWVVLTGFGWLWVVSGDFGWLRAL